MKAYIKMEWQEWPALKPGEGPGSRTGKAIPRYKYMTVYGANEQGITDNIVYYAEKFGMIAMDIVTPKEYAEATGETIPEHELEDALKD